MKSEGLMVQVFVLRRIRRFGAILVMTGLACLSFPDLALSRLSISRMADQYGASIVHINTIDNKGEPVGSGTGFFIDSEGTLVTNYHVVEGCDRALLITGDGQPGEITAVIKYDPERDLLVANTTFKKTFPVPLRPPAKMEINDEVICFGNDNGAFTTISLGRVTDIIPVNDFRVIKISSPILPGLSGAPVLSQNGELMAVATAFLDSEHGLFFAIPAEYIPALTLVNLELRSLPARRARLGANMLGNRLVGLGLYEFQQAYLTVYFKDGRLKKCDRAWLEGEEVYLVMSGKQFAVSYSQDEIDLQKSFGH